jgi:hypothetical protein
VSDIIIKGELLDFRKTRGRRGEEMPSKRICFFSSTAAEEKATDEPCFRSLSLRLLFAFSTKGKHHELSVYLFRKTQLLEKEEKEEKKAREKR